MLYLEKMLYSEKNAFELSTGSSFFEELNKEPEHLKAFQDCMRGLTNLIQQDIINGINLIQSRKILDVGGGDGSLIISLCKQYENILGAVYERPEIIPMIANKIKEEGLESKIEAIQGNFFENIPQGFDTIVMKHILHDWPDDVCLKILNNCRLALGKGGRLFIIDSVLDKSNEFYKHQRYYDILMMSILSAKERNREEFINLLRLSGFQIINISAAFFENIIEAVAE